MIYREESGPFLLYVRTEQRPGASEPEHLFVYTKDRLVMTRWLSEVPPTAELVIDTEGRKQANEETWLRMVAETESKVLIRLLKKACQWLPRERANELRAEYGAWRQEQEDAR